MTVAATSPVTNTTNTSTSSAATASPTVDYNQFLTLLIAEIKNQDPTQPMDPTQSVTQLATISGVQQAMQTNVNVISCTCVSAWISATTTPTAIAAPTAGPAPRMTVQIAD